MFFFVIGDSSVTIRSLQLARLRAAHIWISVALVGLGLRIATYCIFLLENQT